MNQGARLRKAARESDNADEFIRQAYKGSDFDRFKRMALRPRPHQRVGQGAFNCLVEHRCDIANKVRGLFGTDPFHNDDALPAFWVFVEANW